MQNFDLPQTPLIINGITWAKDTPVIIVDNITDNTLKTTVGTAILIVKVSKNRKNGKEYGFSGWVQTNNHTNTFLSSSFYYNLESENFINACSELVNIWQNQLHTWLKEINHTF